MEFVVIYNSFKNYNKLNVIRWIRTIGFFLIPLSSLRGLSE
ncbi:hypothetical protein [Borreliella americana]|nr:hypothetical protein [Borreliella americana]